MTIDASSRFIKMVVFLEEGQSRIIYGLYGWKLTATISRTDFPGMSVGGYMDRELLNAAINTLQECSKILPEIFIGDFESDHIGEFIFYRILELQIEQCTAINILCDNNLFRPAYAVLRSILENMATLIWITLDLERHAELFENGLQPNIREILRRIGWENEYERTFRFLSGFVHADLTHADLYKKFQESKTQKTGNGSSWSDIIITDDELYILETPEGFVPITVTPMAPEEIQTAYEPYLVAKVFDLTIVGLEKLYGSDISNRRWWPNQAVDTFTELCIDNPDLGKLMLFLET